MAQIVSIVPTLMWLQHRLGHSSFGSDDETLTHPPTQKTIEFSPNRNIQNTTLDTSVTQSFTDIEAVAGSDYDKEERPALESKETFHAQ